MTGCFFSNSAGSMIMYSQIVVSVLVCILGRFVVSSDDAFSIIMHFQTVLSL